MNKRPVKDYSEYIIVAILVVIFLSGVTAYSYYSFRNLDNKKLLLASELETAIKDNNIDIYQSQIGNIKELISEGDLVTAKLKISSLSTDIYITKKTAEIAAKKAEAERLAEEKRVAEEKAKQEEAARLAAAKKPMASTYRAPIVATGSCSKNELYVVINVNSNTEQIYRGDPDCRTGEVIENRMVATGAHSTCYNPSTGSNYPCKTPPSKWKIVSKEQSSGQFGPWFLRLNDIYGGWGPYYALHGTDDESTIGQWVSHGCIRHYNQDIIHLYNLLPIGTIVWTE